MFELFLAMVAFKKRTWREHVLLILPMSLKTKVKVHVNTINTVLNDMAGFIYIVYTIKYNDGC
jgi:hypothetical protein